MNKIYLAYLKKKSFYADYVTTILLLSFLTFININDIYGQSGPGTLANGIIPDVTPPSTEAASLAKYGDYQVSYFTGLTQTNIPIYNIRVGTLDLPISISYHGAGVKVDDVSSWVGVNWSLNAGGMISRTVVGLPDERIQGFLYRNRNNLGLAASYNSANQNDFVFFNQVTNSEVDTEPDIFYFNFGPYSGKFFFDEYGKFQSIPASSLKLIRCPLDNTADYQVGRVNGASSSVGT